MRSYIKLLKFLKGNRKLFSLAVLTMLIASLFEGFQLSLLVPMTDRIFNDKKIIIPNDLPDFIERLIDKLNSINSETMFLVFPIVVLGVLLVKHGFVFAYQYLMGDVSQRIMRSVRHQLYSKIQSLSLDYFSEKRTGELVSRILYDVGAIENALSYGLTDLFRNVFLIVIFICTAFSIYPPGALLIFFVFPLIGIPMERLGRRLRKISQGTQEKIADINSFLLETISGIKLVKAFNTENYEIGRFRAENYNYYKLRMKSIKRIILIAPMTEIFGAICGVGMILWIGRIVMDERLSFGVFVLFFGSIMSIISPIKKLGNVNALVQQALAANDRIYAVLDVQPTVVEATSSIELPEMKNSIQLKRVGFSYNPEFGEVLKDIDLEIKKGELVAIVGPTGTGKTTLMNLIPRFYDPTHGSVTIDGIDLKQVSFLSLRRQMGIVTQETILFNDTVKANISYGQENAAMDQIEAAAKKAFAHWFITKMPNGYDTVIGERGFRLSGGEKQRLAIARAILRNPPILLLDEATSQLDSESEQFVQEALDKLMQGRTVIVIAHRLSTINKADKIVVLNEGKIVGLGKHDELLKNYGLYQRLYSMQFQI